MNREEVYWMVERLTMAQEILGEAASQAARSAHTPQPIEEVAEKKCEDKIKQAIDFLRETYGEHVEEKSRD